MKGYTFPPLTDEKAAELKKEHPSIVLHASDLTMPPQLELGVVTLGWKTPTYEDHERFQDAFAKEDSVPMVELMAAVLLWPEPPEADNFQSLYELAPDAWALWLNTEVRPFFGLGATVTTRKL